MTCAVALLVAPTAWGQGGIGGELTGTVQAVDRQANVVYFTDGRIAHLAPDMEVISGGQRVTIDAVPPGSTIIVRGPGASPSQVQVQPGAMDSTRRAGSVASVDRSAGKVYLSDGTVLRVSEPTPVTMTGETLRVTDLQPGDQVVVRISDGRDGEAVSALPRQEGGFYTASFDASEVTIVRRPQAP